VVAKLFCPKKERGFSPNTVFYEVWTPEAIFWYLCWNLTITGLQVRFLHGAYLIIDDSRHKAAASQSVKSNIAEVSKDQGPRNPYLAFNNFEALKREFGSNICFCYFPTARLRNRTLPNTKTT
jgi:hypothetical protein